MLNFKNTMVEVVENFLCVSTGATCDLWAGDVVNGYELITDAYKRLHKPHDVYLARVRELLDANFGDNAYKAANIAALRIEDDFGFPKIAFIKAIRQAIGCSLKEAKDAADAIVAGAHFTETLSPLFDQYADRRVKLELERLAASGLTGDDLANALRDVLNVVAPF